MNQSNKDQKKLYRHPGASSVVRIKEEEYDYSNNWVTELFGHWRNKHIPVTWCSHCGRLLELNHRKPTLWERIKWRLYGGREYMTYQPTDEQEG